MLEELSNGRKKGEITIWVSQKRLTPLKAIRKYCLWCCLENNTEVKQCPVTSCAIHPYRFGHRNQDAAKTPCKAIKAKCTDCSGFDAKERNNCKFSDCRLYEFRNGHNSAKRNLNNMHNLKNFRENARVTIDLKNENVSQV